MLGRWVVLVAIASACSDGGDAASRDGGSAKDSSLAVDAAVADANPDITTDAAIVDAMPPDADIDAMPPDADIDAMPPDAMPPSGPPYTLLSETGLYADIATQTLVTEVVEYEPYYQLWSDGAQKRRFMLLPTGGQINTFNMDRWRYPPGTKFWKQFVQESPGGDILLETRLIEKTGPNIRDNYLVSFKWRSECFDSDPGNDGDCDADVMDGSVPAGDFVDVNGTLHDIPEPEDCDQCHSGERDRILGFQAVQLSYNMTPTTCSHNPNGICPTVTSLANDGVLSVPPAPGIEFPVPGSGIVQEALGYLHANCGHCHNDGNFNLLACYSTTGGSNGGLLTRIYTSDTDPTQTKAYLTGISKPLIEWVAPANGNHDGWTTRIVPGETANSALHYRMSVRDAQGTPPYNVNQQMPPLATDFVDTAGAQIIADWINSLPPP